MLESDSKLLSLGLFPFEGDFISYKKIHEFGGLEWDQYSQYAGLMKLFVVSLETDAVREVRQIYNIWDVLGDIGGLTDMLQIICWPILTFVNSTLGSGISRAVLQ